MKATETKYIDNLIEWSFLVKGQKETMRVIESENGIAELMAEYNKAYKKCFEKFMNLWTDEREAVTHAFLIKTYYGIKKNDMQREENRALNNFLIDFRD